MSTRSDSVNIPTSIYVPYPGRRQARLRVTMTEHGSIYGEGTNVRQRKEDWGRGGSEEGAGIDEAVEGVKVRGEEPVEEKGYWEHWRRNG